MKLDFTTLFAIILLNSVGFALVWAIISISYRTLHSARYWFVSLAMTCISGAFLVLGETSQWLNYIGNLLVIFGLGLLWQGVRVFLDKPPQWSILVMLVSVSALAMVFLGTSQPANNLIFAVSQIIPMVMTLITLLKAKCRQVGIWVAAGSCGLLILGQGSEAFTNALRLAGMMSTNTYYEYASWFLVCAIIGVSISNLGFLLMAVDRLSSELHALATRDELTGLPNRRALNERLPLIEKRAKRLNQSVAVLMIDLNKFKTINDNLGHSAGDTALKHFAVVTKNSLDRPDFLARIGGDEFCILIPDGNLEAANALAETLTKAIASTPFHWQEAELLLAASIGLHCWEPFSGTPLADSLQFADKHLLHNKFNAQNSDNYVSKDLCHTNDAVLTHINPLT